MKNNIMPWALAATLLAATALAQDMPDIGFKSVGRGAPLVSVHDLQTVGPDWLPEPGQVPGTPPRGPRGAQKLDGFAPDALPKGIEPLPVDIFTSKDFYADKDLWDDPRYFRCNSPMATEIQRGILSPNPLITTGKTEDGPWGHCDRGYPRESMVSPYAFKTAQEHYEALMKETRGRGGPTVSSFKDFKAVDWNGVYERPVAGPRNQQTWYWGAHTQITTMLSLLTPEYKKRSVQEAYHQVRGDALWPSTFCWPEGFMRRFYPFSVWEHYIIATPDLVQISAGVADNFVTNVHIGREFNMEDVANGGVPRLGAAVPRWYGETIGFWDGDTLITWTSNVQAWKSHSSFEWSSKMQSVEIYTPIRDKAGAFVGLNHEAIMYDPDALVEPIRIVRNLHKIFKFTDTEEAPYPFIECVQTIFSLKGHNSPVSPGDVIEYEVPDMYGRPWAAIWEKYFEEGMTKPESNDEALFNFN